MRPEEVISQVIGTLERAIEPADESADDVVRSCYEQLTAWEEQAQRQGGEAVSDSALNTARRWLRDGTITTDGATELANAVISANRHHCQRQEQDTIPVPQSRDYAEKMLLVAKKWLQDDGIDLRVVKGSQGGEAVAWQVLDAGGDVHDMFDSLREAEQEACESGDTIRPLYAAPQPAVPDGLHPSVLAFARAMQYKLDANKFKDGKGWDRNPDGSRNGWAGVSPDFLIEKLEEEISELIYEVQRGGGDLIWKEAADVGNIAMMLADVTDALAFAPEPPQAQPDWVAKAEYELEHGEPTDWYEMLKDIVRRYRPEPPEDA